MTYINAMIERKVFDALRGWLIDKGFSYKKLFWLTGTLAFFISPVADNLKRHLLCVLLCLPLAKKTLNLCPFPASVSLLVQTQAVRSARSATSPR